MRKPEDIEVRELRQLIVVGDLQVSVDKPGKNVGLRFFGMESPDAALEPIVAVIPSERVPELIAMLQVLKEQYKWPEPSQPMRKIMHPG